MSTSAPAALGQLANAPLVFVLAQVRFIPSSQANLDDRRDAVRNALPEDFQSVNALMAFSMEFSNAQIDSSAMPKSPVAIGYDIRSIDQKSVARLTPDSLTLAVTKYKNYSDFNITWARLLNALPEMGIKDVERIGLRYIDFIYPSEGKAPEDYFNSPFDYRKNDLLLGASEAALVNVQLQEYAFKKGRMRVQYARGMGQPGLPMDLQGLLNVAPVGARAAYAGPTATFDSDRWIDARIGTAGSTLSDEFKLLHNDLSNVFKQVTTFGAQSEWALKKE